MIEDMRAVAMATLAAYWRDSTHRELNTNPGHFPKMYRQRYVASCGHTVSVVLATLLTLESSHWVCSTDDPSTSPLAALRFLSQITRGLR